MTIQQKLACPSIRSLITEELIGTIEILEGDILREVNLSPTQKEQVKLVVDKLLIDIYKISVAIISVDKRRDLD